MTRSSSIFGKSIEVRAAGITSTETNLTSAVNLRATTLHATPVLPCSHNSQAGALQHSHDFCSGRSRA